MEAEEVLPREVRFDLGFFSKSASIASLIFYDMDGYFAVFLQSLAGLTDQART